MELRAAVNAFTTGFSFTRSLTFPFEVVEIGPLIVMRDRPLRKTGRAQEIIALDLPAEVAVRAIREYQPKRWFLCVIHPLSTPLLAVRAEYKQHQLRAMHSEPFFVRKTAGVSPIAAPWPVERVRDIDRMERIHTAARRRQILPAHLTDHAPIRMFAAFDGDQPVGWVKSVDAGTGLAWVSNLWVHPDSRRRGLGAALMTTMLADDAQRGITTSVLLASTAGASLYRTLGYDEIGVLQMMSPVKGAWDF